MNKSKQQTIIAIETSCDETAVAVVQGTHILSNAVFSQTELHKQYGGVVPGLARTAHKQKIDGIYASALEQSGVEEVDIDAVAVTVGPGLAIALEVGINFGKDLAKRLRKPLVAVNHMEGHLLSSFAEREIKEAQLPAMGLLVSGKHTEFVVVNKVGDYHKVGQTLDDAAGEAFDKVSNMLGLGYPGGPIISKRASQAYPDLEFKVEQNQQSKYLRVFDKKTDSQVYELPIPMALSGDLNVSYSGLKTAVKHLINSLGSGNDSLNIRETGEEAVLTEIQINQIAATFEQAAVAVIKLKLEKALELYPDTKELWMGGGVVANKTLISAISGVCGALGVTLRVPDQILLTADNAGMIGIAAAQTLARAEGDLKSFGIYTNPQDFHELDRKPRLSL